MAVYRIEQSETGKGQKHSYIANEQLKYVRAKISSNIKAEDAKRMEKALNEFFYKKVDPKAYKKVEQISVKEFRNKHKNFVAGFNAFKPFRKGSKGIQRVKSVKQIEVEIGKIEKLLDKQGCNMSKENLDSIKTKIEQLSKQSGSDDDKIKSANEIIFYFLYGDKTVYGDIFEYALQAWDAVLKEGIKGNVEEIFKKGLKEGGSSVSSRSLNVQNLSKADREKLQSEIKEQSVKIDGLSLTYGSAKNKVDVKVTFDDKEYNISAKNYSSRYSKIHILSGSPFSVPVINLSKLNFVNSYLTQLYYGEPIVATHDAIKANILVLALTGLSSSSSVADTFVLNTRNPKPYIYVRDVYSIFDSVSKNSFQGLYINGKKQIPDSDLYQYKNQNLKPEESVISMIAKIHSIKISASLTSASIRKAGQ